ncbi:MAG: spermidine/putrescine ABC transporter substrate-binding protein [Oscillospiraceae bacterium]|nr:spermidine/putrescine ABC transporter substrate-binding protein [Oscillospiraceae bacterium]
MKKLLFIVLFSTLILAGCGKSEPAELWVLNQSDAISGDVLLDFEKGHGVRVVYNTYETPEEMYQILIEHPGKYDVVFATNYYTQRLRTEGAFTEIDFYSMKNYKNIQSEYLPSVKYNIPYMTGTLGVLYDENKVHTKIDSWKALWDNQYRDEIIMTPVMIEALAIAFRVRGFDVNSTGEVQIKDAADELKAQWDVVQSYQALNVAENMAWGRATLAAATSNRAELAMRKARQTGNASLKYIIPPEGSARWIISMSIPRDAKNPDMAMNFIDYMCETDVAAQNSMASGMTSVLDGVRSKLPDEAKNSYVMYPERSELQKCIFWRYDTQGSGRYETMWRVIKANIWVK